MGVLSVCKSSFEKREKEWYLQFHYSKLYLCDNECCKTIGTSVEKTAVVVETFYGDFYGLHDVV